MVDVSRRQCLLSILREKLPSDVKVAQMRGGGGVTQLAKCKMMDTLTKRQEKEDDSEVFMQLNEKLIRHPKTTTLGSYNDMHEPA